MNTILNKQKYIENMKYGNSSIITKVKTKYQHW